MGTNNYDPLSDMARIKESLMSLFCNTEAITRLIMPELDDTDFTSQQNWYGGTFHKTVNEEAETVILIGHCFDTPYREGFITDNRNAIFIETYLTKLENQNIKEVGIDIQILCHKDSVRLSDADTEYYHSIGIYGNRIDSTVQAIHSAITNSDIRNAYSIGNLVFATENPVKQYSPTTDFYGKTLSYTYPAFYRRKK